MRRLKQQKTRSNLGGRGLKKRIELFPLCSPTTRWKFVTPARMFPRSALSLTSNVSAVILSSGTENLLTYKSLDARETWKWFPVKGVGSPLGKV
jgi:hypothetical protein